MADPNAAQRAALFVDGSPLVVDKDGRHGTLHVVVVAAPLVLTLGIPEPR